MGMLAPRNYICLDWQGDKDIRRQIRGAGKPQASWGPEVVFSSTGRGKRALVAELGRGKATGKLGSRNGLFLDWQQEKAIASIPSYLGLSLACSLYFLALWSPGGGCETTFSLSGSRKRAADAGVEG